MSETKSCHEMHCHHAETEKLLRLLPSDAACVEAADIFSQLCDPTRLRILWVLAHTEECVNNIAIAVDMSTSAVSHHLRNLRQAGFIINRRSGKEIYYKLADTPAARLLHTMIDDVFEMTCPGSNP